MKKTLQIYEAKTIYMANRIQQSKNLKPVKNISEAEEVIAEHRYNFISDLQNV